MNSQGPPRRLLWAAGLLLLLVSVLGAGWFLNHSPGSDGASGGKTDKAAAMPPSVVCIGLVYNDPDVANLLPLQSGRIVYVVPEGKTVQKGNPLLKLDSKLADFKMREANADLDNAKEQLAEAKKAPANHKRLIEQQKAAVDAAKHGRESAYEEYKAKVRLQNITKEDIIKGYEENVKRLESMVKIEESKLEQLEKDVDPESKIRRAQADVEAKQAQYDQAKYAFDECTLVAPADGLVLRVFVNEGEVFAPNPQRLAAIQFAPKGKRIVRAEVLQEWARGVKEGQDVIIEDDTYNGYQWKGRVVRLSEWFAEKRHRILEPFMLNDVRTMECVVEITSESRADEPPLRIGQRVRVTIRQS